MSQESIAIDAVNAEKPAVQPHHGRRMVAGIAVGALLVGGGYQMYERFADRDSCAVTMSAHDSESGHAIHLPSGSMVFSHAEFTHGAVKIYAGDPIRQTDFVRTVPAEAVRRHTVVRYEATPTTQVAFQVTENAVTTRCITASAAKN